MLSAVSFQLSAIKIALVTGGGRGLGKDIALSIAKKGIDVVLTYNSNKNAADEVVREIQALGQKATTLKLNVADVTSFDGFMLESGPTCGKPHIEPTPMVKDPQL